MTKDEVVCNDIAFIPKDDEVDCDGITFIPKDDDKE